MAFKSFSAMPLVCWGVMDVSQDHHKLIGAVTEHRVGCAHAGHQIVPDTFEHLVTGRVTQGIVDALEAIEPQKHHRQLFVMASRQGQ